MKKFFKKTGSIILSILIICICVFDTVGAESNDLNIDVSQFIDYDLLFVNSSGEIIDSDDLYGKMIFEGNKSIGEMVCVSVEYGDSTNAYEFLGWYEGNSLVSKEISFAHTYGKYKSLYAKVLSHNILSDGASFESLSAGSLAVPVKDSGFYYKNGDSYASVKTGDAPTGHMWGAYSNYSYPQYEKVGDNYIPLQNIFQGYYNGDAFFDVLATVGPYQHTYYVDYATNPNEKATTIIYPHSGNKMVAMNPYWRSKIKALSGLEKNTDYVLTFWLYTQNADSVLSWAAITTNYEGLKTGSYDPHIASCEVLSSLKIIPNYGEWTEIKMSFNSGSNETVYFQIGNNLGRITGGNEGMNFIDDFTVCKAADIDYVGTKDLVDNNKVATLGAVRYNGLNISLDFTGAGIEFNANCKGDVVVDYSATLLTDYQTKFRVWVDGVKQEDIVLKGESIKGKLVLAKDLPLGEHNIKLVRITENTFSNLTLIDVNFNGEYLTPPTEKPYKFEFYGDSITAGYGVYGESVDNDWGEDGTKTYAYLTAEALNADANIFAYSGIGVTTAAAGGTMNEKYSHFPKDSSADVVVAFLGTNDSGKYQSMGLTKQYVIDEHTRFIKKAREDHPNSPIVMLHYDTTEQFIIPAVEQAKAEGVTELYTLDIPGGTRGGAGHPDVEEQEENAVILTEFLRELLGINSFKVDFSGNAIRERDSALRFKFKLPTERLTSYSNMETKKVGLLVIATKFLDGEDLVIGGKYTNNNYIPFDIEVLAENYQYVDGDTKNTYFTAALCNIDRGGTTYGQYAASYTVRPYVIYEDANGDDIVYYGDAVSASIVEVMKAILDANRSEEDAEIVNKMLENPSIAEVYNASIN